ncbi:MAG: hypothetical protein LUH17_07720 [Acidaminococcaceae bacterium]|nr:hypothetical protein [Acidaminococcaceae bacterium]MCD8360440.1 hypothetical protein [Acidaminococcaceae bacterium]
MSWISYTDAVGRYRVLRRLATNAVMEVIGQESDVDDKQKTFGKGSTVEFTADECL